MKKFIILTALLAFTGCAAISQWTDAQARCAADPSCLEKTKGYAKIGEAVATPWGPVATGAAGSIITFVALGLLGLKKKKDEPK